MRKGFVNKLTLISLITAFSATVATFSAFTYAKYVESKSAGQTVSREGKENISIFLNANIWTSGTDSSGNVVDAVYYMWVVVNGHETGYLVTPTRHINPTVSNSDGTNPAVMDLYVFEYKYNWGTSNYKIEFIRANPSTAITSYTTYPASIWNITEYIKYNKDKDGNNAVINYYCIKTWNTSYYGHSAYEYNRIDKDSSTGDLTWGNPSGANTTITAAG